MTDPHGIDATGREGPGEPEVKRGEKPAIGSAVCGGPVDTTFLRSDPHSLEAPAPGYTAPIPDEARLPAGIFRCSQEEFARIRLTLGEVTDAQAAPEPAGAIRLEVRLGGRVKPVYAVLGESYRPAELVGRRVVVVDNLEPRRYGGDLSYGKILTVAGRDGSPRLVTVDDEGATESGGQVS